MKSMYMRHNSSMISYGIHAFITRAHSVVILNQRYGKIPTGTP